jgi:hypothetical protein
MFGIQSYGYPLVYFIWGALIAMWICVAIAWYYIIQMWRNK